MCRIGTTAASTWAMVMGTVTLIASAEVTVTVRKTAGGPQIFVDGEAVPPRFFFGSRTGGAVAVATSSLWQSVSFDFTPDRDVVRRGTLHFRFHKKDSRFQIRNLRVADAETGRDVLPIGSFATKESFDEVWNIWPPGEKNTIGMAEIADAALHVTLAEPTGGK